VQVKTVFLSLTLLVGVSTLFRHPSGGVIGKAQVGGCFWLTTEDTESGIYESVQLLLWQFLG